MEGYWTEESIPQELITTIVNYRFFTYLELLKIRAIGITSKILLNCINSIENFQLYGIKYKTTEDKKIIKDFLDSISIEVFNSVSEELTKDSLLSLAEYRKLEYITYYLSWKADEFTRRKAYNCDECKKFNYIDGRFCFLENEEYELPDFVVKENEEGIKELIEEKSVLMTADNFLERLDELALKEPELPIFEIGLKYYGQIQDDQKPNIQMEVCPEAIKNIAEGLTELFEMEARAGEYHVLPFNTSQVDQPAIVIEAFDAIRGGRNLFHSKKMRDISGSTKKK